MSDHVPEVSFAIAFVVLAVSLIWLWILRKREADSYADGMIDGQRAGWNTHERFDRLHPVHDRPRDARGRFVKVKQ